MRRTKIVATLGPATDAPGVLKRLLEAGVDVVRMNFSHGRAEDHIARADAVRGIAREIGRDIAILADLQGPKIRIESFVDGPVELIEGAPFALDTALGTHAGDVRVVGCAYERLPLDVTAGDVLLINDGAIVVRVESVHGTRVETIVTQGGMLSNRKGINKQGGGLSAPALTTKDKEDLRTALMFGADFIAVSFPKTAVDMDEARFLVAQAGGHAALVAKIERAEALVNLTGIILASDVVMVARGDLGVEIGDAELPGWQKKIIGEAREHNKLVITATQMMESMITNPIPTRAEVLDVANAVIDGTDAVMLSAETASGKYPVRAVEAMARVCLGAEPYQGTSRQLSPGVLEQHFAHTDEAIAMAATWTARLMHAAALVALTESGSTALLMSRSDASTPIYALTRHERTRRRMCVVRGVYPVEFSPSQLDTRAPLIEAIAELKRRGLVLDGQRVIVTKGDFKGPGGTNEMKILTVGDEHQDSDESMHAQPAAAIAAPEAGVPAKELPTP